jgi:tetratricopeptide (TPR) repeat protein
MTCKQAQEALSDRLAPSTGAMPADLAAHLACCPACRAHAASMEGIARCLADMRAFAAAIPAEVLEENKRRILAAIADKNAKPATRFARRTPAATTSRQQPAKDFSSPRIHPVLLWSAAGVAATLVMIFGIFFRDRTPATSTPEPAAPAVPVVATHSPAKNVEPSPALSAKNEEPRTKNQELPVTLAWLKEEFARLKVAREGVTWDYLNKVVKYLTTGERTLDEKVDGWKLLADAYEAAGEEDRSSTAFGRYLDFLGQRDGKTVAVNAANSKANSLYFKKDYLRAVAIADLAQIRYPDDPAVYDSKLIAGRCYEKQELPDQAIAEYQKVIEKLPATNVWRKHAERRIWYQYSNMGRNDEAVNALKSIASKNGADEDDYLHSHFYLGQFYFVQGPAHYLEAAKELQAVIERNPNHGYADYARKLLASINKRSIEAAGP